MDTKHIQTSRKRLYRRLVTACGLWFGLVLFLMAATSLRRFTTPAAPVDDAAPAPAPNQVDGQTVTPDARPASTQERNSANRNAQAPKQGTADANSARPVETQKTPLRSDAGSALGSTIRVAEAYGRLPLSFEANQGQTDRHVKFLAHGSGYTLFLTGHEAVLALQGKKNRTKKSRPEARNALVAARFVATHRQPSRAAWTTNVLRMNLVAANPSPEVVGTEQLSGRSNYFVGKDSSQWRTGVPTYAKVRYQDVYPGVDLVYYGNQRQLEYDFVVAPGANPKAIKLSVAGASKPLAVDSAGNLVVHLRDGKVQFHQPVVYQTEGSSTTAARQFVDSRFVVKGRNLVAFELGPYDHSRALTIDPTLSYSTYLGGSGFDAANAIAVDANGDAYVAGFTGSTTFPPSSIAGACVASCGSTQDGFVAELKPDGSGLVYSTYLGGSKTDVVQGIAVDSSGNAYVTGNTDSSDFPQVQPIASGCVGSCSSGSVVNAFVTEINAAGNAIVYSTRLGGSTSDFGQGIAVDSNGNAYVAGFTESTDFPSVNQTSGTCVGTCGTAPKGTTDSSFVAEIKPGTPPTLAFSSLLGGTGLDQVFGLALDSSANIYVTGITTSANFPTKNPIATACNGTVTVPPTACGTGADEDAFVTELTAGGSALQFSTYLGGSGTDNAFAIAVDSSNAVYVTGGTSSTDFPKAGTVTGACAGTCGNGLVTNAFVTKLKTDGSGLVYSTYLGGSIFDQGMGIAVDSSGDATVAGMTMSADFPSVNPVAALCAGPGGLLSSCGNGTTLDAFVTQVNGAGSGLSYSMFIGGSDVDAGFGVALDSLGNAYVAGQTSSTDFMTTTGAFQTTYGGGTADGFVTKIAAGPVVSLSGNSLTFGSTELGTTSASQNVTLTNIGSAALNITSITASGDFVLVTTTGTSCPYTGGSVGVGAQCTVDVAFKPTALGARIGSVSIADNAPGTPQPVSLSGTGIDTIPPALTILANPSAIHARNGSLVAVTVSGTITDSGSGVNASTAAFNVVDEYGSVQPHGAVTLGAGGSYSFVVMLQASRLGSDADGRQYTITVSARDNAGNPGAVSTVVTVLHDN